MTDGEFTDLKTRVSQLEIAVSKHSVDAARLEVSLDSLRQLISTLPSRDDLYKIRTDIFDRMDEQRGRIPGWIGALTGAVGIVISAVVWFFEKLPK